ncbi:hypothetical protein JRO89_XS01G0148600 [Xanthoceras sorbifolium]|uniref:Uncharacterized protein n=1 Tax=Xanthoceras sorbifolium TaxID=99658 RepID=A0ABQ8IJA5_9ROSI|nr:hypothetical protein JRO89_XS01G0148600 [Xanthoceras sorbifolium]
MIVCSSCMYFMLCILERAARLARQVTGLLSDDLLRFVDVVMDSNSGIRVNLVVKVEKAAVVTKQGWINVVMLFTNWDPLGRVRAMQQLFGREKEKVIVNPLNSKANAKLWTGKFSLSPRLGLGNAVGHAVKNDNSDIRLN